ncbi:MAG: hypothetical protein ACTSWZ_00780 [Candidatus Heimdallarchaeaceae archaeon]
MTYENIIEWFDENIDWDDYTPEELEKLCKEYVKGWDKWDETAQEEFQKTLEEHYFEMKGFKVENWSTGKTYVKRDDEGKFITWKRSLR